MEGLIMYTGEKLSLKKIENDFLELNFDSAVGSVNKLDKQTLDELDQALSIAQQQEAAAGLLLTSSKNAFIVGADITQFKQMFDASQDQFLASASHINGMMSCIEDMPFPTVVAINGFALGGGLEVCLACDARIISTQARIGLPETGLGILPGWGGTVRLPRLSDFATALEWITSGRQYSAHKAMKSGIVDKVVEPENLRTEAINHLTNMAAGKIDYCLVRKRKLSPVDQKQVEVEAIAKMATAMVLEKTAGHYPAPVKAIELMTESASLTRDQAIEKEASVFYELSQTSQARALIGLFVGDQYVARKARGYAKTLEHQLPDINLAAVVGAGIMGGGIAYQSAIKGFPVVMKDIAQPALDLGISEAEKLLNKAVSKGKLDQAKANSILAMINPTLDDIDLQKSEFVVEAVVEHQPVKNAVLSALDKQLSDDAIIVSNTSSISINQLATSLTKPERFCGMHFFNPVHVMPLVEVIRGTHTSDQTIAAVCNHALKLGKKPIVVNDCPGFLVNRVLFAQCFAMELLLRDGVSFQQIDQVMEHWGMPMGPAYLMDVVGLDTIVHCYSVMSEGIPERFIRDKKTPTEVLLNAGRQGQKNGLGYYSYTAAKGGRPEKTVDADSIKLLESIAGSSNEIEPETIIDRLLLPLAIEMNHCIEEGIVDSAIEADMALIWGVGFPLFRGGICRWMDEQGLAQICQKADSYTHISELYRPTQSMRDMAAAGKKYYP
jgi:3-hydroxyacyl-CoA dehydrogenase/enoyl-CoA hydratase/3-hydroxybutyryl-CoA epimerase/enoyl-CoA isomerase